MSNNLIKEKQHPVNTNSNDIVIDDGTKVYNIKNQRREKIGQFVFNPSDVGLEDRYDHAVAELEDIQKSITDEPGDRKKASDRIKKEFDTLFNADMSGSFFAITDPLTPLESGEIYAVNVLDAVRSIIERETGKRMKRAKTRASKYTQKYHR